MEAFPAFFPLRGRRIVIAGEGEGAEAKARLLTGSPARLERLAGPAALAADSYAGALLAFVAHPESGFCAAAATASRAAGVPVNVVDHPELSDFHTPAIIDRGQVVAAVGTTGAAPIVAALLRAQLEAEIPAGLGQIVALFGRLRAETREAFPDLAERRRFLRAMMTGAAAEAAEAGDLAAAERLFREALARRWAAVGCVWLIAAPRSRDLLSLRAARILAQADLLVADDDLAPRLEVLARRDAPRRRLAETPAAFLAREAAEGRQAVVLAAPESLAPLAAALAAQGAPHRRLDPAPDA